MGSPGDQFAFIYSSRFGEYSYGTEHPFNVHRYRLAHDLLLELGLLKSSLVRTVESPLASEPALLSFHSRDYLATLRDFSLDRVSHADFRYGLGDAENPVFEGLYDWARLVCGGTVEAVNQVVNHGCRAAFNMAGGWHHARASRASGFSYLNDAAIAIRNLLQQGLRVAYIDIDAHHGDGVQEAFYDTDRVLTISLHESGRDFFPPSGFVEEMGEGRGYGYSVNVPFAPHADDLIFEQAFRRIVLPLLNAYQPDILITQMGVDALRDDPLTRLELTTGSLEFAARVLRDTGLPWIILGGGGYVQWNVARGWALIWATVQNVLVPDELPDSFSDIARRLGQQRRRLRDTPYLAAPDDFGRAQKRLEHVLAFLERKLFPLHGLLPGEGK